MSLNEEANLKGYSVLKCQPGPNNLVIMNRFTGQQVSRHPSHEAVREALALLPDVGPAKAPKPEYVGWQLAAQPTATPGKHCSQGFSDCICQYEELFLFCAASKDCENRATHHGICDFHFSALRIFGDLTKFAAAKTEQMIAENDEKECSHGVGYHSYEAAKARYEAGIRTNIILKGRQMKGTAGPSPTTDLGVIGAIVRQLGNGDWAIVDKDANVISQHPDRQELIKSFLFE